MSDWFAWLVLGGVLAVCATAVYVAHLFFLDRAHARTRLGATNEGEVKALRERVEVLGKTVQEHKAILATNAAKGVRR